mmetsp:Transcript_58682/g.105459  ORF Transcript_58682/g.105459 Transcript_58682/m.105459 type:complete len:105 (+) Transcript_58682:57-371(+)
MATRGKSTPPEALREEAACAVPEGFGIITFQIVIFCGPHATPSVSHIRLTQEPSEPGEGFWGRHPAWRGQNAALRITAHYKLAAQIGWDDVVTKIFPEHGIGLF